MGSVFFCALISCNETFEAFAIRGLPARFPLKLIHRINFRAHQAPVAARERLSASLIQITIAAFTAIKDGFFAQLFFPMKARILFSLFKNLASVFDI